MAVVQLSKIQIRRGQKNTGSGLPQLASGELGWALDTRELYIGNGAVSEGAPAVGNTKILTQYDDLFSLANTYSYKQDEDFLTGANSSVPVQRTLQERLDDRVSVRAFGAVGDGVMDDTESLQRAVDQLYLSSSKGNPSSRVKLHFEAGTYKITDTLYVPANATLLGAGKDKTVIRLESATAKPVIKTVNDSSTPENPAGIETSTFLNQPRNIKLAGFTLEQTTVHAGLLLEACRDSFFNELKIIANWEAGNSFIISQSGIKLDALSAAVKSDRNVFENTEILNFSYGVRSDWDVSDNLLTKCVFKNLGNGIVFGESPGNNPYHDPADNSTPDNGSGKTTGPIRNVIQTSIFENIYKFGIYVAKGSGNSSEGNFFELVGNEYGSDLYPVHPIIQYNYKGNVTKKDWFSRTENLIQGAGILNVPYVPEIKGAVRYSLTYENEVSFGNIQNVRIFRLPGYQDLTYKIHYTITSQDIDFVRSGTLEVAMLNLPSGISGIENRVELTDSYSYIGAGDEDSIRFSALVQDLDDRSETSIDTISVRAFAFLGDPSNEVTMRFTIEATKPYLLDV